MGRIRRIAWIGLLTWVTAWRVGTAEPLPWEKLPFSFRPLVQTGSANLLPNADFRDGLKGWDVKGDAVTEKMDGKPCLRLAAKGEKGVAAFQIGIDGKPETLYRLAFRYRVASDAKLDYADSYPGLHGWLTARVAGGKVTGAVRIHERRRDSGWVAYETHLFTPQGTKRVDVSVAFNATQGAALLTGMDLREAKVEAAEGRQVIVCQDASWAELPRHAEPAPPTDVTVFQRRNPDELFFY
ncbi:MAG: hypothetical protein FJ279_21900, partial [Planctomycetes bacterium]|nr:hypothetical protein [Planctomycetota bacterium]